MNGVKNATLNILTKGQKAALKSAEQQQKIEQERAHRDTVIKAALEFINSEIADNIFKDIVVDFKTKGFASFNYYLDLAIDYVEALPDGVIELPADMECPTAWNKETKRQEPTKFTLNRALRSRGLREYIQQILDTDYPGFSIRIFADDHKDEDGDPNKFTIKLRNENGKQKRGGKGKGKGRKTITAGKSYEDYEAEEATRRAAQAALNK
tara:strand:+ start:109 stop:738 length:630 start_codon:yes stop_codon:yes gene_type:complete